MVKLSYCVAWDLTELRKCLKADNFEANVVKQIIEEASIQILFEIKPYLFQFTRGCPNLTSKSALQQ